MSVTFPLAAELDRAKLKTPAALKKKAVNVSMAMLFFAGVYLFILLVAVGLAALAGWTGVWLMSKTQAFYAIALGISLIFSGVMLVFFVIKFMFKGFATNRDGLIEINESEQPELFKFIRQLTLKIGVPFPKHIYMENGVNAGVFYDSAFWSMFFPVKKNLMIGAGLVNAINIGEFEAIMAHEFGHFSQRSMKFGSYVYNINRIIDNLVNDDTSYQETIRIIGNIHVVVKITVMLNLFVVRVIKSILRGTYAIVNKQHLALSREMEYHADAIAAYTAGGNNMINALHRIELGSIAYRDTIAYLNTLDVEKKRSANIYQNQTVCIELFAQKYNLPIGADGLPVVGAEDFCLNDSDIEFINKWASHPSIADRAAKISNPESKKADVLKPASSLFNNLGALQQELTNLLYLNVSERYEVLPAGEIDKTILAEFDNEAYPEPYHGYYDRRYVTEFDMDGGSQAIDASITLQTLLNADNCRLPLRLRRLNNNLIYLESAEGNSTIDNFKYKNVVYGLIDIPQLKVEMQHAIDETQKGLDLIDRQLFQYFYQKSNGNASLTAGYKQLFLNQQYVTDAHNYYRENNAMLRGIYKQNQSDREDAIEAFRPVEKDVQNRLQKMCEDDNYTQAINKKQRVDIAKFVVKEWNYYDEQANMFNESIIQFVDSMMWLYCQIVIQKCFLVKKDLLKLQLSYIS